MDIKEHNSNRMASPSPLMALSIALRDERVTQAQISL